MGIFDKIKITKQAEYEALEAYNKMLELFASYPHDYDKHNEFNGLSEKIIGLSRKYPGSKKLSKLQKMADELTKQAIIKYMCDPDKLNRILHGNVPGEEVKQAMENEIANLNLWFDKLNGEGVFDMIRSEMNPRRFPSDVVADMKKQVRLNYANTNKICDEIELECARTFDIFNEGEQEYLNERKALMAELKPLKAEADEVYNKICERFNEIAHEIDGWAIEMDLNYLQDMLKNANKKHKKVKKIIKPKKEDGKLEEKSQSFSE